MYKGKCQSGWGIFLSSTSIYGGFYLKIFIFSDAKGSIREIILPKGLDLDRPKRTRTSFTAEQLYRLEMEFQRCQYVVGRERTELARQLNLSETQVQTIFTHFLLSFVLYTLNETDYFYYLNFKKSSNQIYFVSYFKKNTFVV